MMTVKSLADLSGDPRLIRVLGVSDDYLAEFAKLTAKLRVKGGYLRLDRLEPPADRSVIEHYQLECDRFYSTTPACKEMSKLYRASVGSVNPTIEQNLIVTLMYWFEKYAAKAVKGAALDTLVYTGRLGYKEYLFLYMVNQMGANVIAFQPEGEAKLSPVLLRASQKIDLGRYEKTVIPPDAETEAPKTANTHSGSSAEGARPRVAIPPRPDRRPASPPPVRTAPVNRAQRTVQPTRPQNAPNTPARELTYEELARLASSVVMIGVCGENGEVRGTGSGIAISSKGYILTNCHVVSHGQSYLVRLENDDKTYECTQLIKYHKNLDMAIIRIDKRLDPLKLYSGSTELVRGQKVVAIGSPMGLFNSVSDGIIAGFRQLDDMHMIQFTAPISSGSSGGALLNTRGEVIGMCTASIDKAQNMNLAVSYKQIMPFIRGFL